MKLLRLQWRARIVLLVLGVLTGILLAGCGGSSSAGLAQRQLSAVQVKTEVPSKVQVNHSYDLRVSLVPKDGSQNLSDIVVEQTTIASAMPTPAGTPGVSIAKAFGAGYAPYATAALTSGTFDVTLVGQETQSLQQPSVVWDWNITPHQAGAQVITGAITVEWLPTKQPNNALPPPTYTIATIQQGFD